MSPVFVPGTTIVVREVLHGEVWLHFPETVLSDDGHVLATVQDGAAAEVAGTLERDDRWWSRWDEWAPVR